MLLCTEPYQVQVKSLRIQTLNIHPYGEKETS
jgi:hypothetical protein